MLNENNHNKTCKIRHEFENNLEPGDKESTWEEMIEEREGAKDLERERNKEWEWMIVETSRRTSTWLSVLVLT